MEAGKSEDELEKKREKRFQKEWRRLINDLGVMDIDEELDKKYQQTCSLLQERIRKNEEIQLYVKNPEYLEEKIAYFEYGINGLILHRGFYCPSPVMDIVVGNCKRGRRVQQIKGGDFHHEYGFDNERRLVRVRPRYKGRWGEAEILVYEEDTCIGYSCDWTGDLEYLSEAIYEKGKLRSYKKLNTFKKNGKEVYKDFHEEKYEYDENGLKRVYWIDYYAGSRPHSLTERVYYFKHDENKYLSKYFVKEVYSNPLKYGKFGNFPEPLETQWYKVYLKRKV